MRLDIGAVEYQVGDEMLDINPENASAEPVMNQPENELVIQIFGSTGPLTVLGLFALWVSRRKRQ